jgi:hypothetical protein
MSELAFNVNGDPFEIPAGAVAWRVRKMKPKGAPEVAYGRNGQPLVLPIEADLDDLRAEVNAPGKYRLDPIDAANKPCEGAPAGYVYVHELLMSTIEPQQAMPGTPMLRPLPPASDNVVIEAMRMNAEIARLVVDKFPQVVEASAVLLRAADGAGLPARPGMVADRDDEDDDEDDDEEEDADDTKRGGFDIGAFMVQMAPVILSLTGGKLSLPDFLNWTKAAEKGAAARQQGAPQTNAGTPTAVPEPTAEEQLRSDPAAGMHFMAIMSALAPAEAELARTMAKELSNEDRTTWFNALKSLSVEDAVAKIRAELERLDKKGGAS